MPEVDIQREPQRGVPWWVWVIGAVVLALIIWAIAQAITPDRRAGETPPEQVAGQRQEDRAGLEEPDRPLEDRAGRQEPTETAPLPIGSIQQNPEQYHGQEASGMVTVAEVVSDRGFWAEQDGNRIFVLDGETVPSADQLSAGQQIQLQGRIYRTGAEGFRMPQVEGMDQETARTLQEQPVFIHATALDPVRQGEPAGARP